MNIPKHEDIICNPRAFSKQSLIKKFNKFYNHLQSIYPDIHTTIEQLYLYMHNLEHPPICSCGNKLKFLGYKTGYRTYCCEKCAWNDKDRVTRLKNQLIEKYGISHISQLDSVKEKVKQTCLEKYGGMGFGSDEISERIQQTCLEKYGVRNAALSLDIKEKTKQTCLEKYGEEYAIASKLCREKIESTFLNKYGAISPTKDSKIKEKIKQTCLEKYGGIGLQSPNIKEKIFATNLKKYNTEIPSRNKIVKQDIIKKFQSKYNVDCGSQVKLFEKYPDLLGISNKIWVMKCPHPECNKCQEKYFKTRSMIYHDRLKNNSELCTNLLPINKSHNSGTSAELFIRSILDKYNINYIVNNRSIITPKELDIYIPSKKIAIECNGVYWHSTNKVVKKYHFDKYQRCKEMGIQLLTFWDDQIHSKPDIIESILLHKLGISLSKIYARNCKIVEIDNSICTKFLNENHIQGSCRSKYKYGLYYGEELVSIMTFGISRVGMGNKDKQLELLRFCTKKYYNVVGGASKLLNFFIKNHNPKTIISYSSNDISNGNLYKQLNFIKSTENLSYWYIDMNTKKRYHRFNFTKFKLVDIGFSDQMPESEIMKNIGLLKIFDCGQVKWILNV